jgi:hypothetical protein
MKLALIVDAAGQESYYMNDSKAYNLKTNKLYTHPHTIDSTCMFGIWSYTMLFPNSYMINITKTPELPKLDFDIIITALELPNWHESLNKIRHVYSNAIIIGTIKEPGRTNLEFLNSCDKVASQYSKLELIPTTVNKFWLPHAIDVDYIYDKFFVEEKKLQLFQYHHHVHSRRGQTANFCKYISDKYHLPIIHEVTMPDNSNQLKEFIYKWRDSIFHVNLDPEYQYGNQALQTAVLGCINIGGHNDTNYHIYPNTATIDFDKLEHVISKCIIDTNFMINMITDAWNKVNREYSLLAVSNKLKQNLY